MSKMAVGAPGWTETHLAAYLKTDGAEGHLVDFTIAGGPAETPCLILKTTGRRSGESKLIPLIYGEDAGRYVIIASKGGAPEHPLWVYNLRANPLVEVQDGPHRQDMTVRELSSDERAEWWMRAVDAFPPYGEYQQKTTRQIPVFLLEPVS